MSYSIKIDHTNKIIQYCHRGDLVIEDIGKAWVEFLQLDEFTQLNYNLLSDYSKAKFNKALGDVHLITDFLISIKEILNNKKQALLLDDPANTALSMIFEKELQKKTGFIVRVFSTQKAAFNRLVE
jgi:hypothetical protein